MLPLLKDPGVLSLPELAEWFAMARPVDEVACKRLEYAIRMYSAGGTCYSVARKALVSATLHRPCASGVDTLPSSLTLGSGISSTNHVQSWSTGFRTTSLRSIQL